MPGNAKLVCGAFPLATLSKDDAHKYLDVLKEHGVDELDTARIYEGSEEALGELRAPETFVIDTKARGFAEGSLTRDSINQSIDESFRLLKVESVNIFYLHSPDPATLLEETLDTINSLYVKGKFKKFGLSNYKPEDVRKVYSYCKEKGYVLPTVYQGNYNAFARKAESTLFPVLRELEIAFYAYSPIAGGFLAKTPEQILEGQGRFDKTKFVGQLYLALYDKPSLIEGLGRWAKLAEKAGISRASLAYRWIAHSSGIDGNFGDAIIVGARTPDSLSQTLGTIEDGPLDAEIVREIEDIWKLVENEAPLDNYNH